MIEQWMEDWQVAHGSAVTVFYRTVNHILSGR